MKGIMLSVRRRWFEKICSNEKRFELRKTSPRDPEFLGQKYRPIYFYIPETRLVEGAAIFAGSRSFELERTVLLPLGMTDEEIEGYGVGKDGLYHCWGLSAAIRYGIPVEISVFGLTRPPQSWQYVEAGI